MYYKCSCCGYYTLSEESDEICQVCAWQEDIVQRDDPDFGGGPNLGISLNQARDNYNKFRACNKIFIHKVRNPRDEEKPENNE